MKQNCWEYMQCGRHPGGKKEKEHGPCPSSVDDKYDGINDGKNAGRHCWKMITHNLCCLDPNKSLSDKLEACLECDFFRKVYEEEKTKFVV